MSNLSVSVIIPVYNGERFLAEAMESVARQGYEPIEIIVVDDGSTDATPELIARLRHDIRYIQQPNRGPAAARNRGLEIAGGDLVAFLDVDDIWPDEKLVSQADHLRVNSSVQIVQGLIQEIRSETANPDCSKPYFNVNLGAFMFRKSVFEAIGLFDETLLLGEDVDFMIRAWENGIAKGFMNKIGLIYRKHSDNMTNGVKPQLIFARLFKKYLDRCRESSTTRHQKSNIAGYFGWDANSAPHR